MKKIELEIIAISHSITQRQSYAVVLGEVNGSRRLPIVIGGFEAQAIAVALEKMNPSRPLTHDLMKNFLIAFGIDLHEVIINDLQEGVFYSKLVCSNEQDTIEIDSRTSDAIAMAVIGGVSLSGGRGSILGTALGMLIFGVIFSGFIFLSVDAYYQNMVKGAIIVGAVALDQWRQKRQAREV